MQTTWKTLVLSIGAAPLLVACATRTPALDLVLGRYPELESGVYQELARWERVLGEPDTIPQADGGATFFYWPQHGIAVFTHPQYEGQFARSEQEARKVTSVIVPLKESFDPSFLPVEDEVTVHFDRLLDLGSYLSESMPRGESAWRDPTDHIDLVSSPLRKTVERLHFLDGEPTALEIRDAWWLSHYD